MDTLMIGLPSSKQLVIRNTGCDSLKVTNITHLLSEFTVSPTSFVILPRDTAVVNVNFLSLNIGNYTDVLTIFNNAGNINVNMKAKTLGAPEIITLPDLITANISCDTSSATLLKLKNPGIVPLNWNAFVAGQEKGALQFNGVNNYISTGYWSPGNKWTVEAWVNPDVLSYGTKLIAGSAYGYAPWGICMVDSKFAGIYYSSQTGYSQTLVAENFNVTAGAWYHVACTYNGTTIRLFINGQQVKSAVVNSNYTAYNYPYIGGDPSWANYFSGKIDEVRIWNIDRSQSKISYTMNHIMPENETGLQAYWLFNKLNGSTVFDKTSNGRNGNFNGTINSATFTSSASPASDWVNLSTYSGVLGVGDSTYINVNVNRHLLPQGTYPFNLIIQSDDPAKPYDTTFITLNAQYNLTQVDLGSDTNLCTGNSLTVFAGSYSSYVWSNNTFNSSLNVTSTGTYNVLVTDANGCKFRDTIYVGLTQSPIADGGLDKSVCQNNSVSINGSATGGTPPYQYIWKDYVQNIVSNVANYSFVPANSTKFFLSVTDNNGCQSPVQDTVYITLNPNPIVSAGNDTTINSGTSVMLNGSISGGTYPYTIQWSPYTYMSATNILNPLVTPNYAINYYLNVTDANNCSANDGVNINVKYILSGFVVYNNVNQTPMPNVKVYLENSSNVLKDSVLTATDGSFMFSKVDPGTNFLYAKPVATFGGVNATDALGIRRHIVGFSTLSGVNSSAADVNGSTTISSADALVILRRTIGLISSFPVSDWTSEKPGVYMYYNVMNISLKVLCTGDVNGSYNIFSSKSTEAEPELSCIPLSNKVIAGETFNLPVNFTKKIKLGAVTLNFRYPHNLIDIIGVTSNGNEVEYSIKNDILSLAMADEKGLEINGNNLLLIKCRVKSDALNNNIAISLSGQNELADINGKVISGLQLETNCLGIAEKFSEYKLEDIYPNPFSDITTVRIFIPEDASLRLSIINSLGVEVKSIQTERLSTGWHELKINAGELTQGAYMYRMQAVGSNTTFDQTRRMMIIR
ncbi:MAG: dockerin type I domain-containing protein [Bacteroidetes bacterium]|nr:dockerin type I domain-containing protein [Bacteroidota bacterium]